MSEISKYDLEYMGVKCTGVEWSSENGNVFYFTKDGKEHKFKQGEDKYYGFVADTDYIRCVIKDQFLPWLKDERIKELEAENADLTVKNEVLQRDIENLTRTLEEGGEEYRALQAENAELKEKWNNQRCVYSFDGEVMEYCVNGPCEVDRTVSEVREENAELRARLDKAVEFPFCVIDKKTGKEADIYNIALNEEWANHLIYCDMEGFAIQEDGTLVLLDECNNMAYCPFDRFEIVSEARLAELKGERK